MTILMITIPMLARLYDYMDRNRLNPIIKTQFVDFLI